MPKYRKSPFMPVLMSDIPEWKPKVGIKEIEGLVTARMTVNQPATDHKFFRAMNNHTGLLWQHKSDRLWVRVHPLWRQITPKFLEDLQKFPSAMSAAQIAAIGNMLSDVNNDSQQNYVLTWWVKGVSEKNRVWSTCIEVPDEATRSGQMGVVVFCADHNERALVNLCRAAELWVVAKYKRSEIADANRVPEAFQKAFLGRHGIVMCEDSKSESSGRLVEELQRITQGPDKVVTVSLANRASNNSEGLVVLTEDNLPLAAKTLRENFVRCSDRDGSSLSETTKKLDEVQRMLPRLEERYGIGFVAAAEGLPMSALYESSINDGRDIKFSADSQASFVSIAKPIYSTAKMIVATSSRAVSTFWDSPSLGSSSMLAKCETIRLFIFRDHQEFMEESGCLMEHLAHYQKDNPHLVKYYVTSETEWRKWCGRNSNPVDVDVAYVFPSRGEHFIRLKLSRNSGELAWISDLERESLFAMVRGITRGIPAIECFHFTPNFFVLSRQEDAIRDLQRVFGPIVPRTGVHHVLVFHADQRFPMDKLKVVLSRVRAELMKHMKVLKDEFGLLDITYGERRRGGELAGRLYDSPPIRVESPCDELVLIMRFRDDSGLDRYYRQENPDVQHIFKSLYSAIAEQLNFPSFGQEKLREILEIAGTRYYSRVDWSDRQTLEEWFDAVSIAHRG